ncbi:MAG: acyltransferase [Emcibacteraceae bacterium]|nr:acyltransferase [Emcibacteraceae bacterium]
MQNGVKLFGCKNIRIGDDCFFGRETKIFAYKSKITIGSKVIVAENVKFISHEHKFADSNVPISEQGYTSSPIIVGNDVWIGFNCIILPGVKIGDGVVIGAGSIVNSDIPDNYIAAGSPARLIKHREQ